jgi:hypothetical protein
VATVDRGDSAAADRSTAFVPGSRGGADCTCIRANFKEAQSMVRDYAFGFLTGTDCNDLERGEARNGLIHIVSLTLTKTADSLIDPKLVLSWLLSAVGAPGAMIGALVPVREAGALLPQLALARRVEARPQRKFFWSAGSAIQGMAAVGIAAAALTLDGATAGLAVVLLVAVLACGRSASSVSYKDVLARTIAKRRRGAVTGFAASMASVVAFCVGGLMASGVFTVAVGPLAAIVATGGIGFLLAALLFMRLKEAPGDGEVDGDASIKGLVEPIFQDDQLRLFVAARGALAVTALAPPFIVMLSAASERTALDQLGPLVMASTSASALASYVWGRLSDRSSRQTLMAAGWLGSIVLFLVGGVGLVLGDLGGALGSAAAVFAAQISYEGVRAGRKLHLTDMAEDDFRARYTALSNTLIGLALLAGGLFGLAADQFGPAAVVLAFGIIAAVGAVMASGLKEVQRANSDCDAAPD